MTDTIDTEQLARALYDRVMSRHQKGTHHHMVSFGEHAGYAQDMAVASRLIANNPGKTIAQILDIVFPLQDG